MQRQEHQHSPIKSTLAALLFGSIMTLSFSPWSWWWVGLASAAGLLLLLKAVSASSCFWRSFWFGMGLFGTGASWVFVSIHEHGNASVPLAASLTLLFVTAPALSFALPMTLFRLFNHHATASVLAFPSLWVLAEWFRSWLLTGFPWLYFGYSFIDTPMSGWAPIGGVLAISWVGIFTAATLMLVATSKKDRRILENCLILVVTLWSTAWYFSTLSWTNRFSSDISVGVIQPALPLSTKWDQNKLEEILQLYSWQTDQLHDQDIIVWPESAIPQFQHQTTDFLKYIDQRGKQNHSAIITGIPTQDFRSRQYYNSVIGLGTAEGTYHKQHLVPFGEYVPLENWLRGTIDFFDLPMSRFSPGPENQPLISAGGFAVSTAICYEIVFPDLVSKSVKDAHILLTVSNDSWFGDSLGPKQHLQMARMRALENSKPLIRSTNDGISALIDKKGEIIATIPASQQTVLSGEITPQKGQTPFNRWGSIPVVLWSFLMIFLALRSGKEKAR